MRALLFVILFTLVAAPAAAQQASMEVTVNPPASLAFQAGSGAEGDVTVTVSMEGVACTEDTTINVDLSIPTDNLTSTMTATVAPSSVTINVTGGTSTTFSGSGTALLNVTATNDTEAADYDVVVVGTVNGVPSGCTALATDPPSNVEGSGVAKVTVSAAPPPPPPPPPPPEDNGIPAPGWAGAVGALGALALAFRRRF